MHPILKKALAGERINSPEALELYERGNLIELMSTATELRNRRFDAKTVTYTLFRIINYTTICDIECSFCSFHAKPDSPEAKDMSATEVCTVMKGAMALGVNQLFLQGGVNSELSFDYYIDMLRMIKKECGAHIHIRGFSPVEILGMSRVSGFPLEEVIRKLKEAGLDSVPGAGAEILTERMRNIISPNKCSVAEWVRVMETCSMVGLYGSANIVFGSEESKVEVIEHLSVIRDLQDRTGVFLSFIPWTFQQQTKGFKRRKIGIIEFLKVVSICRIFLDNIEHLESSVLAQGRETGALALYAGADDISSVVFEENVLRSYGLHSETEAREFILESGFKPVQRDLLYNIIDE